MAKITVIDSGHVDRQDSAFPTLVRLDNGDIVCGFSVGGGPSANGPTHCARSSDQGRTWSEPTVVAQVTDDPKTTNHLRLSRTAEGALLAYGTRDHRQPREGQPARYNEPWCRSDDGGRSWSPPQVIEAPVKGPYEISNPIVVAPDGSWLGPAATWHGSRCGASVVLFESCDGGATWPQAYTVFEHPQKAVGYAEQKVIALDGQRMLAVAWTLDFSTDRDLTNAFTLSPDGGRSWQGPYSTGLQGQTMTPLWLGEDRLLVLYNRRYGE